MICFIDVYLFGLTNLIIIIRDSYPLSLAFKLFASRGRLYYLLAERTDIIAFQSFSLIYVIIRLL